MGIVLDHFCGWSGLYVVVSPPLTRWQEVVRSHEEVPGSTHTGAAAGWVGCSNWWSNWMDCGISHGIPWHPMVLDTWELRFLSKDPLLARLILLLLIAWLSEIFTSCHSQVVASPFSLMIWSPLLAYIWWFSYLSYIPSSWLHCHCWF